MAKDRILFLLSFAFLGIVAALLFRADPSSSRNQESAPQQALSEQAKQVEVLASTRTIRPHERFNAENCTWTKIPASEFDSSFVMRDPDIEKVLFKSLAAKEIPQGKKIARAEVFWPIEKPIGNETTSLPPGKRVVSFTMPKRSGLLNYIRPQGSVDVAFRAKSDSGFGPVNLTLLRNIKVLNVIEKEDPGTGAPPPPPEIVLEMSPKEADVFYYAQDSGELSLELLNEPSDDNSALIQKLMDSDSPASFRSILVTHFIQSLFPNADISVTMMPSGYVASGRAPNELLAQKIVDVIGKLSPSGAQAVVSLIQTDPPPMEEKDAAARTGTHILQPEPGKMAVMLSNIQNPLLFEQLTQKKPVNIRFSSKADVGFGAINITLFRSIPVLGRQSETIVPPGKSAADPVVVRSVALEMSPRDAEIFQYAQSVGEVSLDIAEEDKSGNTTNNLLANQLSDSRSTEEFRSTLITHLVQELFPGIPIRINVTAKGYVLEGKVADPQKADKILEIVQKLAPADDKSIINLMDVEPQQVLIHVKVLEVDSTLTSSIGVNWQVLFNHDGGNAAFAAVFPPPASLTANYFVSASDITAGNFTLSALVNMLEEDHRTHVLASPNLTTTSGKTARFFAGGEFPILIPQGGTLAGTVTVEFKKYGVLLEFTPLVDLNGLVTLQVVPEVSAIDRATSVVLSGFVIPGLTTRRVETSVKLWPGQSYAIGGLLQTQEIKKNSNLFGLNRLPIIGPLFTSQSFETNKTELMIIITPFLLTTDRTAVCYRPPIPMHLECEPEDCCEVITQWEESL